MRKYYKFILILGIFISILIISSKVEAATADLSLSASGNTITATISVNAAQWDLKVSGDGVTASGSTRFSELDNTSGNLSKSYTATFNAPKDGTYTITLKGDVTDINGFKNTIINVPKTVTVKTTTNTPTTNANNDDDNLPTANNGTTTTTVQSSNNYLKSLSLSAGNISFDKKTTKYTINVGEEVESITIKGEAEDTKAKGVQGTGTIDLKKGNNTIRVSVTAENGSVRTYTLTVIRAGQPEVVEEEETEENLEEVLGLDSLILKGVKDNGDIVELLLTPEFSKEIFYYECSIPEGVTFIDVEQVCDILDAIVEVTGNDNLGEEENLINIIIQYTDENGEEQTITYQVLAKREAVDAMQEIEEKHELNPLQIGIILGSIGIALMIITILIVRYCKQQKEANEDEFGGYGEPFYSEEEEEEIFEKPMEEITKEEKEEKTEEEKKEIERVEEEKAKLDNWEEFEEHKKKRKLFGTNAKKGKHF